MQRITLPGIAGLALIWWMLASPEAGKAWWVGVAAVAAGGLMAAGLGRGHRGLRISLRGLLAFLPFFLNQSLRGGMDVARRALSPSLPLSPAFIRHPIRLQGETSRIFFLNLISLLPGTFSARLEGDAVTVHLLAGREDAPTRLAAVEARVARIFGESLAGEGGEGGGHGALEEYRRGRGP